MQWLHAISELLTSVAYATYATAWLVAAMRREPEN